MGGRVVESDSPLFPGDLTINNGSSVYTNKNLNEPTKTFVVVLITCLILFLLTMLLFSWLRTRLKRIYSPRLLLMQDQHLPHGKLPSSWFAWISPAMMAKDDDIFNHLGLDALVYIRFLRLLIKASIFTLPYGIFILIPLNFHGGMHLKETLDRISLSNVRLESPKLWAHLIALWVYSLSFLYIVNEEWKVYVLFRQIYLTKDLKKQHVALVQDVPKENQNDEKFEAYVSSLFPDQVHSAHVVKELSRWQSLIDKHNRLVRLRERLMAKQSASPDSSTNLLPPGKDRVMAVEGRIESIQEQLQEEQEIQHRPLASAFVFFKTASTQSTALQTVWDFQAGKYLLSSAPSPCEIHWSNLGLTAWQRLIRQIIGYLIVSGLIVLWAVPITFIASLTNLQTVSLKVNFLDKFAKDLSMIAQAIIQGILPVALTAIFNLLLPSILAAVGKFSGIVSKSRTQLFVFSNLTMFLICNTFFFFMLAGSFFSKIQIILDSPHRITDELAVSLPRQANFYLCYVSLMAFVGTGYELTRITQLCFVTFFSKCWAKSPREKLEAWYPGEPPFATLLANDILVFLIGITYSVISPVIIPAVIVYFAYRYIVWVYQLHYVYVQKLDLCGRLWPRVSSSLSVGAVIFQLLMIGVFTLKKAYWIIVCASPLPFVTIVLSSFIHKRYGKVAMYLSRREGLNMRSSSARFLQNIADSYVRNLKCPGTYDLKEYSDIEDSEGNEEIPFCVDGQNGL